MVVVVMVVVSLIAGLYCCDQSILLGLTTLTPDFECFQIFVLFRKIPRSKPNKRQWYR